MSDILFLGTGASVPSRDRGLPCIAIRCGPDVVLFDCGEGSQRQLMVSPFSFMKIKGIFITHMHGDHFLGLPGLLQTLGLSGRKQPLTVCGPRGFKRGLEAFLSACEGEISYPLEISDMDAGDRVAFGGFSVSAFSTEHKVPSLGYVFAEDDRRGRFDKGKALALGLEPGPDFSELQNGSTVKGITPEMVMGPCRPGCRIAYSGDTVPCGALLEASRDADVLIHESTFSGSESALAKEHWHSTSVQAAEAARDAGCRHLILTHISNRYDDRTRILEEARAVFPDTDAAKDMSMFEVTPNGITSASEDRRS